MRIPKAAAGDAETITAAIPPIATSAPIFRMIEHQYYVVPNGPSGLTLGVSVIGKQFTQTYNLTHA
jgi:hypothetical protein